MRMHDNSKPATSHHINICNDSTTPTVAVTLHRMAGCAEATPRGVDAMGRGHLGLRVSVGAWHVANQSSRIGPHNKAISKQQGLL